MSPKKEKKLSSSSSYPKNNNNGGGNKSSNRHRSAPQTRRARTNNTAPPNNNTLMILISFGTAIIASLIGVMKTRMKSPQQRQGYSSGSVVNSNQTATTFAIRETMEVATLQNPPKPMSWQKEDSSNFNSPEYYDVNSCPYDPPRNYPRVWSAQEILQNWQYNATLETMPSEVYQGLCVFDYEKELDKAWKYKNSDLPFVLTNTPEVNDVVQKWHKAGYVENLLMKSILIVITKCIHRQVHTSFIGMVITQKLWRIIMSNRQHHNE